MYGGQSTYIPMKINSTGVMPLIFGFAFAVPGDDLCVLPDERH